MSMIKNCKTTKRIIDNHHILIISPYLIKFIPTISEEKPKIATSAKIKYYGFDLDSTLIQPKSKSRFGRHPTDWEFLKRDFAITNDTISEAEKYKISAKKITTLDKLLELNKVNDGNIAIVIFSNQGGVVAEPQNSKSCINLINKLTNVLKVINDADANLVSKIWIYCAPKMPASFKNKKNIGNGNCDSGNKILKKSNVNSKNNNQKDSATELFFASMRKPNIGMFESFCNDVLAREKDLNKSEMSLEYYCGDAAGRDCDFSDSDKKFSESLNVKFILPEEFLK
ncbi:uncharacterized protein SCODWIG_01600 [Saccharomycodes ludwigii]|uniref:Polynucleotide 3'-phosphatase n=2 Tax=Saccharomycodes ludwigii TaxID=36035 RepID=A0A376B5H9_9ASCO|nr:uncharacterized protein SCODWIG_01600 [Saccharomycodes ludwigii]